MFLSWGFGSHPENHFSVCEIDKVIYYHKFKPSELDCFWNDFVQTREYCYKDGNMSIEETEWKPEKLKKVLQCDPANWHIQKLKPPILTGPQRGKCGPTYGNAGCSTKSYLKDDNNTVLTPCCKNGICSDQPASCLYPGKDFREKSDENWEYADGYYLGGQIPNKDFGKNPLDPLNKFSSLKYRSLTEAQVACLGEHAKICSGITRLGKGVKNTFFELRMGKKLLPAKQVRSWKKKA